MSTLDRTDDLPLAPGPERGYRWVRQLSVLAEPLRTAPVTLVLLAALWIIAAATDSLHARPPHHLLDDVGVGISTLGAGHWWTPVTSLFWCAGIAAYVTASVLLVLIGPQAERRIGSPMTAGVLLGGQIAGTLLGTGLVRLGVAVGSTWTEDIKEQIAVGPTPGIFALAMVLSFRLTTLWKRRLHLLGLLVPLVMALYVGHLASVQRLAGGWSACWSAWCATARPATWRPHRSSHTAGPGAGGALRGRLRDRPTGGQPLQERHRPVQQPGRPRLLAGAHRRRRSGPPARAPRRSARRRTRPSTSSTRPAC